MGTELVVFWCRFFMVCAFFMVRAPIDRRRPRTGSARRTPLSGGSGCCRRLLGARWWAGQGGGHGGVVFVLFCRCERSCVCPSLIDRHYLRTRPRTLARRGRRGGVARRRVVVGRVAGVGHFFRCAEPSCRIPVTGARCGGRRGRRGRVAGRRVGRSAPSRRRLPRALAGGAWRCREGTGCLGSLGRGLGRGALKLNFQTET